MKKILLILVLISFFGIQRIQASHFAGNDLTYTCLGGNTYLVSLSFYRDCSGIAAPSNINVSFTCSQNSSFNFNAYLNKISGTGQEITPSCSSTPTYCASGTSYGIQEYVYQATITLTPCNSWNMSYSSCCRNPVTTVTGNNSNAWYMTAELNNLNAPCNSSPTFSNIPIVVANNNELLTYSHGAVDPDGDSLVYSFFTPKTQSNSVITYNSPYDSVNFLSSSIPITIDPNTGQITLKPNLSLIAVTGVKVEEWRKINGVPTHIGTVYRDIQLKVYNTTNAYPTLAGMRFVGTHGYSPLDTIYSTTAFATDPVYFSISGFDSDTFNPANASHPEQFSITWNNGISQGNFTTHDNGTDHAWAEFNWIPSINDVSGIPHCFTTTIIDDACPYKGKQIFTYCITVSSPPPLHLGKDTNICINNQLILDGGPGDFSFQWSTGDTSRFLTIDGNTAGLGNHDYSLSRMGYGTVEKDTITITVEACAGINASSQNLSFSVMPNPNHGVFDVSISSIDKSDIKLNIYNTEGKIVFSEMIQTQQQDISKRINLENLSKGIYFLKIQQGNKSKTQKILIQ